jgi:AraC-like DNA-binding protein
MSKTRQRFPDGPVWVRTHPITHLTDHASAAHAHDWHQLTFAVAGHITLETETSRWSIPTDHALWVPAGTRHRERMRAPVSVRSLYFAPGAVKGARAECRALLVAPLFRELVAQACRIGALDRRRPVERRLIGVLLDQLASAPEAGLALPLPRDGRARRLAALIEADPGAPLAQLARRAGGSLRTLERRFLEETGVSVGAWRRRRRLFQALDLLGAGASVGAAGEAVGYATTSAFSAAFRDQFGRSPSRDRSR